jgi:hypothetical protein
VAGQVSFCTQGQNEERTQNGRSSAGEEEHTAAGASLADFSAAAVEVSVFSAVVDSVVGAVASTLGSVVSAMAAWGEGNVMRVFVETRGCCRGR